ncbi:unnamed protein product [Cunninghamella echinulata]
MVYNLRFWEPRRITAKSANQWGTKELSYFNIEIIDEPNFSYFFKEDYPTSPIAFRPEINEFLRLTRRVRTNNNEIVLPPTVSPLVKKAIKDLFKVTKKHRDHESCVDDLATSLLMLFQYDNVNSTVTSKVRCSLTMSEQDLMVTSNLCVELLDNSSNILLLQENKSFNVGLNAILPEGQMMAEVISAYKNNTIRHRDGPFPAIIMLGTQPTFYLINMTSELVEAVRSGTRPDIKTIVRRFKLPTEIRINSEALLNYYSAEYISVCYYAFKKFMRFYN